jgi:RNA polymerase sigma factor (sigma-70 family)
MVALGPAPAIPARCRRRGLTQVLQASDGPLTRRPEAGREMNPWLLSRSRLGRSVLEGQTDERLAELVADGSVAAFELIVVRHRRSLIARCARIVGDGDAEEAVQDALVKAHAALARGDEVRNVRAWLHAVAHNTAVSLLRDRATNPGPANGAGHAPALDQDDQVERREELREVVAAVQALPERQRDALVMRELEGRSYEEIASRMGASHGAVRQLLNRARTALRDRLGLFIGPESLIRFASSGTVASAIRVGVVSGGCALTIKVCATLVPAAVAGHHPPVAPGFGLSSPAPARSHRVATTASHRTATNASHPTATAASRPAATRSALVAARSAPRPAIAVVYRYARGGTPTSPGRRRRTVAARPAGLAAMVHAPGDPLARRGPRKPQDGGSPPLLERTAQP